MKKNELGHRASLIKIVFDLIWICLGFSFICWLGTTTLLKLSRNITLFGPTATAQYTPDNSAHTAPEESTIDNVAYALSDGSLWLISGLDGNPEKILGAADKTPFYTQITWAPDGKKLIFGRYYDNFSASQEYLIDIPLRKTMRSFDTTESVGGWSPDSQYLAYFKYSDSTKEICSQSSLIDSSNGYAISIQSDVEFLLPSNCPKYGRWSSDSKYVFVDTGKQTDSGYYPEEHLVQVPSLIDQSIPNTCVSSSCELIQNPTNKEQLVLAGVNGVYLKTIGTENSEWKTLFEGNSEVFGKPYLLPTGEILIISDGVLKIDSAGHATTITDGNRLRTTEEGNDINQLQFTLSPDGKTLLIWGSYFQNSKSWLRLDAIDTSNGSIRKILQIGPSDYSAIPFTKWIFGTSRVIVTWGGALGTIDVNSGEINFLVGSNGNETNINGISSINYPYPSPTREWLLFSGTYASNEPRWYIIDTTNGELAKLGPELYPQDVTCGSLAKLGRWNGAWSNSGQYLLCGCARAGVNHACIFDLKGSVIFETPSETSSAEWTP